MRRKHPQDWDPNYNDLTPVLSSLDMSGLRGMLKSSFTDWANQFKNQSIDIDGLIVVCDPSGHKVAALPLQESAELTSLELIQGWNAHQSGLNAIDLCLAQHESAHIPHSLHTLPVLSGYHSLAEPILSERAELLGVIGLMCKGEDEPDPMLRLLFAAWAQSYRAYLHLGQERAINERLVQAREYYVQDLKKREVLFQVAKKLHANIDVDSVLSEIIQNMKDIYPEANIELYLSQDSHSTLLMVKPLMINQGDDGIQYKAFFTGEPVLQQDDEDGQIRSLAVPLRGKQGVYGVLHVEDVDHHSYSSDFDVRFISQLADSAGTAFENARLHESSNVLINELRLINEITRRLNQSLKLNEVFQYASDELIKIFNADYGLILQADDSNDTMVVQYSNLPEMEADVFTLDYGYAGIMYHSKEPVIISDYSKNPKVRSKLMESTGARSMIGSPILVGTDVVGVIMIAHRLPHYFSYDNYKLLQVLSGHIGLAITNASLHAEVRRMAVTDNLTGLYARHYLDEQINQLQKKDFCGSLILVDIDLFKTINDTYGHQIGDQTLQQVSRIIKSSIRNSDIAARWGGEELAIYLPQLSIEQTARIAERIRSRVEQESQPTVTVSCGVSEWNWEDDKISVESLFYRADMALYEAKRNGRNQVKTG